MGAAAMPPTQLGSMGSSIGLSMAMMGPMMAIYAPMMGIPLLTSGLNAASAQHAASGVGTVANGAEAVVPSLTSTLSSVADTVPSTVGDVPAVADLGDVANSVAAVDPTAGLDLGSFLDPSTLGDVATTGVEHGVGTGGTVACSVLTLLGLC